MRNRRNFLKSLAGITAGISLTGCFSAKNDESDRLGSIEPGKLADLCAVRMDALQTTPMFDVVSHLIYAASSQQVSHVWVAGRMLLQDGQFQHLDIDDIIGRARTWAKRIAAHNGMAGVQTL